MVDDLLQFCTFYLDKFLFGIDATSVREISRYQEITPVPLAAESIEGLINLRGQIIIAINLRKCLKLGDSPPNWRPFNLVLNSETESISLLVDEIGDVIEVDDKTFETPPGTLEPELQEVIIGVYKLSSHRLLHIVDTEKIMAKV